MPESIGDRMARAAKGAKGSEPKPAPTGGDLGRGAEFTNFTVALERAQHRTLRIYALDCRCAAGDVIRALLAELAESPELESRIAARVAVTRTKR